GGCAAATSGAPRRLRVSITMHPTALYPIVVSFSLMRPCLFPAKPNATLHLHRGAVQRRFCPTPTALPGVRCKRSLDPQTRLPCSHSQSHAARIVNLSRVRATAESAMDSDPISSASRTDMLGRSQGRPAGGTRGHV